MNDIPYKPRRPGKHILTEREKEYIKSYADENGVISLEDYIKACNSILNRETGNYYDRAKL